MSPEASDALGRARTHLQYAETNLRSGVRPVASREAYMAMLHAARAFIWEKTGREAKTHRGTRAMFADQAREHGLSEELSSALGRGHRVKEEADYGDMLAASEPAESMIAGARTFIAEIQTALGD